MSPVQVRILSIVGAVVFLAFFFLPDLLRARDAPLKPGGQMVFGVSEVLPKAHKAYPLRVLLHDRPAGFLELQVKVEHGERFIKVDPQLRPKDMTDAIEFPLAFGDVLQPGALWLPAGERRLGSLSSAGLVKKIKNYKFWKAIEVEGTDGGARYYELETGLLVGFEVKLGRREVAGSLMSIQ